MYEHPIYKSAVFMKDQADCDYAKSICIKHNLSIWEEDDAFDIVQEHTNNYLHFRKYDDNHFYVDMLDEIEDFNVISIGEFETLCEELSPEEDITDIISRIKELNNIVNN